MDESAWSAADGSFALETSTRGPLDLWISAHGFTESRIKVDTSEGPVEGVDVRLETGAVVAGRVLGLAEEDRGRRARVILYGVTAFPLEARLRDDGTFRFGDVPSGTWTLAARRRSRKSCPEP